MTQLPEGEDRLRRAILPCLAKQGRWDQAAEILAQTTLPPETRRTVEVELARRDPDG